MQMKSTIGRFFDGLFSATALALLLSGGVLLYTLSWSFRETEFYLQARWFPDDAFYYFNVARNAVLGYGLTFDRINATNGFQPLWQAVCVGIHFLVPDRHDYLNAVNVVQSLLFALGMYLVFRSICLKSDARVIAIICLVTLFFFFPFFMSMVGGLETALYFCCLSGTLYTLLRVERDGLTDRRALGLGIILTATILARLDAGLLGLLVASWVLWKRPSRRIVLMLALPFVVFVLPYFAYNQWTFGSPMPISGAVKRAWGAIYFNAAVNNGANPILVFLKALLWPMIHPDYARFGILVLVNLGLAVFYGAKREAVLFLLQLFFVVKYVAYVTLFHNHAAFPWYYTVDYLGPLLALPYFFGKGIGRFKIPRGWTHAGRVVLIAPLVIIGYRLASSYYWSVNVQLNHQLNVHKASAPPYKDLEFNYLSALEINQMGFPAGAVFAATSSGVLGYFMDCRVVNLDGLVNGKTRLDYIQRHGKDFFPYIDEAQPIDGYIDIVPDPVKEAYDRCFITDRGFEYIPVKERINAKFGYCPTNGMIVYVKGVTPQPVTVEAAVSALAPAKPRWALLGTPEADQYSESLVNLSIQPVSGRISRWYERRCVAVPRVFASNTLKGYAPSKSVDGNRQSFWCQQQSPGFIVFTFPEPVRTTKVIVEGRPHAIEAGLDEMISGHLVVNDSVAIPFEGFLNQTAIVVDFDLPIDIRRVRVICDRPHSHPGIAEFFCVP